MRLEHYGTALRGLFRTSRASRQRAVGTIVRKVVRGPARCSVACHDGVRHVFATTVVEHGHDGRRSATEATEAIRSALAGCGETAEAIRLSFFLRNPELREPCRSAMAAWPGETPPVVDYVMQKPADGAAIVVEAWGLVPEPGLAEVLGAGHSTVVVKQDGMSWVHCGGACEDGEGQSVYGPALQMFRDLDQQLDARGVRFGQVLRTWLYLGDIVGPDGETQRYKELNRARSDFFAGIVFDAASRTANRPSAGFPASTGIGADGRGLGVGALALVSGRADVHVVPLENPRQTAAYDYAAVYSPKSPKFSRAMAVACETGAMVFVSGTASITGSETQHVGDAAAQTQETLDNIAALIGPDNLAEHGLAGHGGTLGDMTVARVYIKRPEDHAAVRAICEARLGSTPICYTIADVCRDDLLVEIEGVACTGRTSDEAK